MVLHRSRFAGNVFTVSPRWEVIDDVTDHVSLLCLQMASVPPVDASGVQVRAGAGSPQLFPCTYPGCGHVFHVRNTLVRHQRMKHGSPRHRPVYTRRSSKVANKPFSCYHPGCTRSYFSKPALLRHVATHGSDAVSYTRAREAEYSCHRAMPKQT